MTELHHETLAAIGHPYERSGPSSFSLENGSETLGRAFRTVETRVLEDVRTTTDAASITDLYLRTGGYDWASNDQAIPVEKRRAIPDTFRSLAQHWIDRHGSITTVTMWTAFLARDPR